MGLNCAACRCGTNAKPFRSVATFSSCHHIWQNQEVPRHRGGAWPLTHAQCFPVVCLRIPGLLGGASETRSRRALGPSAGVGSSPHLPGLASSSASPDSDPEAAGAPRSWQQPRLLPLSFCWRLRAGLPARSLAGAPASAPPSIAAGRLRGPPGH